MANKGLLPMDLSGSASQVAESGINGNVPLKTMPRAKASTMLARKLLSSYILPGWRYKTSSKICKIVVPSLRQVTMLLKSRFEN